MSEHVSPARRLGRAPRGFDPTIPHLSALTMAARAAPLPPLPNAVHWAATPVEWGMMLNDRLGCCTIAAAYHLMQVWSAHGRERVLTEADAYVERGYRELAGYDGTPATDNGAVEQDVLKGWLHRGLPIAEGTAEDPTPGRSYPYFHVEVDPRNRADVCRTINDCGGVYLGFEVPAWLMETDPLPEVWNAGVGRSDRDNRVVGGHAVCAVGYDLHDQTLDVVSWGRLYRMTFAFWDERVDEAYGVCHPWWVGATGRTPLNLPVADLEAMMSAQAHGRVQRRRRRPA